MVRKFRTDFTEDFFIYIVCVCVCVCVCVIAGLRVCCVGGGTGL